MKKLKRVLFLQTVFSEKQLEKSKAISSAANLWQYNFLKEIQMQNIKVLCLGSIFEPIWPKGKMLIKTSKKDFVNDFVYKKFDYINLPFFKDIYLFLVYFLYLKNFSFKKGDLIITYNKSFLSKVVYFIHLIKKISWICIVADLNYPKKASGYVYLSWNYFKKIKNVQKKLFIDGGVYNFLNSNKNTKKKKKIILYSGTIGESGTSDGYAGLSYLLAAFSKLKDQNINLWICGKGKSNELTTLLKEDKRIKFYGFVKEKKLISLCKFADIFVNPRPSKINEYNFPSKILFYLNFNKPIISNKIGLSPKYNNVLFLLKNEKIETLKKEIERVLLLDSNKLKKIKKKIVNFKHQNSWKIQIQKFIKWVNSEISL